jgi:hypothetical protein
MTSALSLIPEAIIRRAKERDRWEASVLAYVALPADSLVEQIRYCLCNVVRLESEDVDLSDVELQLVLLPELCERLVPGSRDRIRRTSSTLAEYHYDPTKTSIFKRLRPQAFVKLGQDADRLRARIAETAKLDTTAIVEKTRFAIAGHQAARRWKPDDFVYDPALVYRFAPALAWRALQEKRS